MAGPVTKLVLGTAYEVLSTADLMPMLFAGAGGYRRA